MSNSSVNTTMLSSLTNQHGVRSRCDGGGGGGGESANKKHTRPQQHDLDETENKENCDQSTLSNSRDLTSC